MHVGVIEALSKMFQMTPDLLIQKKSKYLGMKVF